MGNRIKEFRKRLKISQEKLGRAIGTSRSQIVKLERGERRLTQDWMERLAVPLGVPPAALMSDEFGSISLNFDKSESITLPKRGIDGPSLPPRDEMPLDVEVRGTRAPPDWPGVFFQLEEAVVNKVRRPPGIRDERGIYALYVVINTMAPRFYEGELIYVSERRPARPGDFVLVEVEGGEHDERRWHLGLLKRRTNHRLVLEQFNPPDELQLNASEVKSVHRVLTMNDLFGI